MYEWQSFPRWHFTDYYYPTTVTPRNRALNAFDQVNGVDPADYSATNSGFDIIDNQLTPDNPCGEATGINWVTKRANTWDGFTASAPEEAITYGCRAGLVMTNAVIIVNSTAISSNAVYTGSATPGGGQADLWSILTHEAFHFAGRLKGGPSAENEGHYAETWSECPGPGSTQRHTMCPEVYPEETMMRTPATYDIQIHRDFYSNT